MAKAFNSTPEGAHKARLGVKRGPTFKKLLAEKQLTAHSTGANGVNVLRSADGRIQKGGVQLLAGNNGATKPPGRPKGSKNIVPKQLKEMLLRCDELGVKELERQIQDSTLSAAERREAVYLAWVFRHGKPKEQITMAGPDGKPLPPGTGISVQQNTLIVAGGTEEDYVRSLRSARGEEDQ